MICHFALIIALLCLEPSRGALRNYMTIPERVAGRSPLITKTRYYDISSMNIEASQKIQKSYSSSPKRLILLDDYGTIKPSMGENSMSENSAEDHGRIMQALEKLSANPRNEVWIISDGDVGVLEDAYGHIPKLHFAGYRGTQLGINYPPGIILPQRSREFRMLCDRADALIAKLEITPEFVSRQKYSIDYSIPLKTSDGISNEPKVTEMKKALKKVIKSSTLYRGCRVEVSTTETEFRVVLEDKERYHKGTLTEALFRKQEQVNRPFTFGLSMSDMEIDEPMQLAMRQHGHHAIVVNHPYKIDHVPWYTYASHRLVSYRDSIDFLEGLAATRDRGINVWHRALQSFRGIGQKIQLLIKRLQA